MALDSFFHNKIESMKLEIIQGQAVLRRLEAQRNDYNSRVRLLREELGLLQQPGSYVGEVVKVMGTKNVLVKVHPEGKYGKPPPTLSRHTCSGDPYMPEWNSSSDTNMISHSGRHIRLSRHLQTHHRQTRDPPLRLLQARKDPPLLGRPPRFPHDGRESPRQHLRHDRRPRPANQRNQRSHRARPATPRALRIPRHRPAQRRLTLRPPRHRKNTPRPRGGPPRGLQVYPRVRLRARPEIHRRGLADGARAVRHGARARPEHHLHGRDRQHRLLAGRGQQRRRQRGAADNAGAVEPARRLRADQEHQGHHGDQPSGHLGSSTIAAGQDRSQDRIPAANVSSPSHISPPHKANLLPRPHSVEARADILRIHSRSMNLTRGINLLKIAEKMNGCSGAELKGVCTEAGMFALRERRVHVTQEDFDLATAKVLNKHDDKEVSLGKLWK